MRAAWDGPMECAVRAYQRELLRSRSVYAHRAREYLASRGLSSDTCRRWGIGFAPPEAHLASRAMAAAGYPMDEILASGACMVGTTRIDFMRNRVTFPIEDAWGRVVALGGRRLAGRGPKYLNTRETASFAKSSTLYALPRAAAEVGRTGAAVVCEGYMDAIALHEAGFRSSVAVLGTSLTRAHLESLASCGARTCTLLLDGDEAGKAAAIRAASLDGVAGVELRIAVLPGGVDPDEAIRASGPGQVAQALGAALPARRAAAEAVLSSSVLRVPGQRVAAWEEASAMALGTPGEMAARAAALGIAMRLRIESRFALEATLPASSEPSRWRPVTLEAAAPAAVPGAAPSTPAIPNEERVARARKGGPSW